MKQSIKNRDEILAIEDFRASVQHVIFNVMKEKKISQKKIAELLECSPSNISQILSEDGNPTIETVARIFFALGDKAVFSSPIYAEILERHASTIGGDGVSSFEVFDEDAPPSHKSDECEHPTASSNPSRRWKRAYEEEKVTGESKSRSHAIIMKFLADSYQASTEEPCSNDNGYHLLETEAA